MPGARRSHARAPSPSAVPVRCAAPRSIGGMADTLTLLIEPLPADATVADLDATFREVDASAPALRVGELSTQRGDGIFETIGVVDGHAQEVASPPRTTAELGPHLRASRAQPAAVGGGDRPRRRGAPVDRRVRAEARAQPRRRARPRADGVAARRARRRLQRGAGARHPGGHARPRLRPRHRGTRPVAAARREDAELRGEHGRAPRGQAARRRRHDLRHERRLRHGGADVERHPAPRRRVVHAGAVGRHPARHDADEPVRPPRGVGSAHRVPRHPGRRPRDRGCRVARLERAAGRRHHRARRASRCRTTPTRRASSTTTCCVPATDARAADTPRAVTPARDRPGPSNAAHAASAQPKRPET